MKRIMIIVCLAVLCSGQAAIADKEAADQEAEILAVMTAAETGWNTGDLDLYMDSYWRSDELRFAGGDRVNFGWEAVLAGYKKRYPDRATMGVLTFSELDVTPLGPDVAMVFGRWHLDRDGDAPENVPKGLFTLLLRRLPEGWRIVHDHTSSG